MEPAAPVSPAVTVFGPDPLLNVTVERRGESDDIHVHVAGQGVWVSRMVGEMGARPVLCCLLGGETGAMLRSLLDTLPGERRVADMAGPSGCYVVDRRVGERRVLAAAYRPPPQRHEVDDLVAATCAAALTSAAVVVCNPFPAADLPDDVYATVVGNARSAGVPVIVDLSSPRLDRALEGGPDLVKLNDWELAQYVAGPVDGERALAAMRALRRAGAGAVAVTRAEQPILVLDADDDAYEIVPPRFTHGFREGCGDTMTGALAAGLAQGRGLREALMLGAAAGAGNFLRHGLGTGRAQTIAELAKRVRIRPARWSPSPSPRTAA
ncbi:MAG TPA: PfkB family carbohydrate kinase, partial [Solirubrobacteraceae bacterium]|nr:PfkB family carbohydrate kinase [Solirubrobacteraceae bacterium]